MEELEGFAALTIHRSKPGTTKILGSGEAANFNKLISVSDDQIENVVRLRWPAVEHERLVTQKHLQRKEPIPWKEYYHMIEDAQTHWHSSKPRLFIQAMNKATEDKNPGGGKRQATANAAPSFSTTPVAINESYAYALRKMVEGEVNRLWFTPLSANDEIEWENSEIIVEKYHTAWAYLESLFYVDDYLLKVYNTHTGMTSVTRNLEVILKKFITTENPPKINAVRVSRTFVVVSVQSHGALVMINTKKLSVFGFIPGNVTIATPGDYDRITVGMTTGVIEYWSPNDCAPPGEKKFAFRKLGDEQVFTNDTTTASKRTIKMRPQPVWNIYSQGPRVAVSTQLFFVMTDKNPATSRIVKLEDVGTLAFFTVFGDLVVSAEPTGVLLVSEFASGTVFYRSDMGKNQSKGATIAVGSQCISVLSNRVLLLLGNGDLLKFQVGQ